MLLLFRGLKYRQSIPMCFLWLNQIFHYPNPFLTFYEHFPPNSNELNTIKEMLDENKMKAKAVIRAKLMKSEKAAELLALYRLICTREEHQLLNQSYIDHTTKGDSLNKTGFEVQVIKPDGQE